MRIAIGGLEKKKLGIGRGRNGKRRIINISIVSGHQTRISVFSFF